jgi:hypothetical protein
MVEIYRTKKGYFYKEYKNGKKSEYLSIMHLKIKKVVGRNGYV